MLRKVQNKEQQILELFHRGDASAMDELYACYADYLTAVCYRYIPDDDKLKDVLQESFIKIFTKVSGFEYRGAGSLKAWLTRIVVNEALNALRREGAAHEQKLATNLPDLPDEEPDVGELNEETLLGMIGRLPQGCRTVFNLFVMEDKSHKEIAACLGIKPDTSASQLHKAKALLARMINEYRRKNGQT